MFLPIAVTMNATQHRVDCQCKVCGFSSRPFNQSKLVADFALGWLLSSFLQAVDTMLRYYNKSVFQKCSKPIPSLEHSVLHFVFYGRQWQALQMCFNLHCFCYLFFIFYPPVLPAILAQTDFDLYQGYAPVFHPSKSAPKICVWVIFCNCSLFSIRYYQHNLLWDEAIKLGAAYWYSL